MQLGRVVGCVWATVKDSGLEGYRMLLVQPLDSDLRDTGKRLVCTDWTGAGAGEMVYWVRGREASIAFLPGQPPSDATIVGIVDSVHRAAAKTSKPARQPERSHDRKGVASSPGRNIAPPEN
ncbi:MAG: EutN/CcmL family microcompartment protein [Bryobacteraceae bacterium]|jgi:ethanolamine utilization protein EutN